MIQGRTKGRDDIQHSILIVSASEQFDAVVKKSLKNFITIDRVCSVATARRHILERYYDLVVVCAPMPDETGEEFVLDTAERCNASVLLVVPQEVYEDALDHVTDHGVLVVSKADPPSHIDKAIRLLTAMQNRLHMLEKKTLTVEEKMEEIRIVSRAKILLVEKRHMTEEEAHRYIGKYAMDHGLSKRRVAEKLLEELDTGKTG